MRSSFVKLSEVTQFCDFVKQETIISNRVSLQIMPLVKKILVFLIGGDEDEDEDEL